LNEPQILTDGASSATKQTTIFGKCSTNFKCRDSQPQMRQFLTPQIRLSDSACIVLVTLICRAL
jgi:hypothetical protein